MTHAGATTSDPPATQPRTIGCLVAGVGHRFWRDFSAGVLFADRLQSLSWPAGVTVEDYGFHALAMMQNLQDSTFKCAVFLASEQRERRPGTVAVYRHTETEPAADLVQAHIGEAGAGVVSLDHLLIIASHFQALPRETWVVEMEPVDTGWGDGMSEEMESLFPEVRHVVNDLVHGRTLDYTENRP